MTGLSPEEDEPSGHWDAVEMNRLRGVAVVQAAETEAVLAEILRILDPSPRRTLTARHLLDAVRKQLDAQTLDRWSQALGVIEAAIKRRNRIVHDTVQVGYSWREYATGGGTHVAVISLLGSWRSPPIRLRATAGWQLIGPLLGHHQWSRAKMHDKRPRPSRRSRRSMPPLPHRWQRAR
jgi:hypothetical protein